MKSFALYFLLFILLALLQSSFIDFVFPSSAPSIFIPFLVSLILYSENMPFIFGLSALSGFFLDLTSSSLFGLNMLLFLIFSALFSSWKRVFFHRGFGSWLILVGGFDFLFQLSFALLIFIGGYPLSWGTFFPRFFWHLFYTILIAPVFYFPSRWMLKTLPQRKVAVL